MPELTQEQARTLADGFLDASKAVGDYRFAHFTALSDTQQAQLRALQHQLTQQAVDLTAEAIEITLDDLKPSLERIGAVTKQVKEAVAHLEDVHKVIGVATSFVSLGVAIVSGNPASIAAALSDTVSTVQAAA